MVDRGGELPEDAEAGGEIQAWGQRAAGRAWGVGKGGQEGAQGYSTFEGLKEEDGLTGKGPQGAVLEDGGVTTQVVEDLRFAGDRPVKSRKRLGFGGWEPEAGAQGGVIEAHGTLNPSALHGEVGLGFEGEGGGTGQGPQGITKEGLGKWGQLARNEGE